MTAEELLDAMWVPVLRLTGQLMAHAETIEAASGDAERLRHMVEGVFALVGEDDGMQLGDASKLGAHIMQAKAMLHLADPT